MGVLRVEVDTINNVGFDGDKHVFTDFDTALAFAAGLAAQANQCPFKKITVTVRPADTGVDTFAIKHFVPRRGPVSRPWSCWTATGFFHADTLDGFLKRTAAGERQ